MTLKISPAPMKTSSGAPLPLVALPQGELLTVNEQNIPLIHDALGPGVHFKPLRLDLEAGCWVVLARFSPGAKVPLHYHTGIAEAYTLSGSWHYLEYPDQLQTAGSYLYEPGGSVHTFVCPESNTEDTTLFIRVEGGNVNFSEDGQFHSILDAVTIRHLTEQLSVAQGVAPVDYLGGGAAGFMARES
ncbi:2,4'-dihydroxyacetophenone dioxygenase family protein [Nocardia lijiangensis]|uniref:2,4'-dihydroxyacetophenone dioxygenase family protein n=1 Tax=Nocardia lijiangensis TaxID=299618 RepID=UPI00082B7759|nr:2,4'-dihydroxyacetophenone dioxygenase family protein [Nocardia lijiangensis]